MSFEQFLGRQLTVSLTDNRILQGKFVSCDQFENIVLHKCEEWVITEGGELDESALSGEGVIKRYCGMMNIPRKYVKQVFARDE
jgi:small nuclear ribonucleoprotein (snRNP)-like protein